MKEASRIETPLPTGIVEQTRSTAQFLRACFNDLSQQEAEVIAIKLLACAERIEQLQQENEDLLVAKNLEHANPSPVVCKAMSRFWLKMAERMAGTQ